MFKLSGVTPGASAQSLPSLDRDAFPCPLSRHRRLDPGRGINLRSCELHHPIITALIQRYAPTPEMFQLYPFPVQALERIAHLIGVPADELLLSPGSDAAISLIVDVLGSEAKTMISFSPTYFGWEHHARLRGLALVSSPLGLQEPRAFSVDDFLTKLRSHRACMVVVANPNSPTGLTLTNDELLQIADVCTSAEHTLVIDECFAHFAGVDHSHIRERAEKLLLVRSFSKSMGLAGARIALTICSASVAERLNAHRLEGAVSGGALHLLESLLSHQDDLKVVWDDIIATREWFVREVVSSRPGWSELRSGGNFVAFYLASGASSVVSHFAKHAIHIRDLSSVPGLHECVRFGVGHRAMMQEVLRALRAMPDTFSREKNV